jgi:hypothetical protein
MMNEFIMPAKQELIMIRSSYSPQECVIFNQNQSLQTVLPLFQPLRLWTPRNSAAFNKRMPGGTAKFASSAFTMKGGYIHGANGERRLVIAGKIVKNEGMES